MRNLHRLAGALATVLAAAALAAPMAVARPIGAPGGTGSERVHDLRHLDAGSSSVVTLEGELRAVPAYSSYDEPAPVAAAQPAYADAGTPWTTIGIAISAACFLVAAAAAVAARPRRNDVLIRIRSALSLR
jgi:hypothetical protein